MAETLVLVVVGVLGRGEGGGCDFSIGVGTLAHTCTYNRTFYSSVCPFSLLCPRR